MTNLSNRSNRPDLIKRRIGQRQSLRLKKFIAACVTCFLCFSCENEAVYDQYQAIQNTSWEKNKEYYFTFLIEDISVPYDLTLEVRNNNMYPYQNLWVFCSEELPIGPLKRDTIECKLMSLGNGMGTGSPCFNPVSRYGLLTISPLKGNIPLASGRGCVTTNFRAFRKSAYGSYLLPLTLLPRSVQTKKNKQ